MSDERPTDITPAELYRLFNTARNDENEWRREMRDLLRENTGITKNISERIQTNSHRIDSLEKEIFGPDGNGGMKKDVANVKGTIKGVRWLIVGFTAYLALTGAILKWSIDLLSENNRLFFESNIRPIIHEEVDNALQAYQIED